MFALCLPLLALACAGDDLDTRLGEIRARQDQGRAAETLDDLAELRTRHGGNAEISYRLGLAMIAAGRPTEAVFPLHEAAETDEFAVQAGLLLASTLAGTSNHAEALRAADRVLEHDPEHEAALMLRATAATQLHDGVVALEAAERLVAKAPDNRNYAFVYAAALAEADRLDDADAAYRELLDADWQEESQGAVRACGTYARFLIEKRKDTDEAVEQMKGCVEKRPDDIQMVAALGNMLNEFDRDDDLLEILQGAVEKHPESRPLRDSLISQLVTLGRLDEAHELSAKWADEAKDANSWSQVASVRRRLGDLDGALEAVERASAAGGAEQQGDLAFFRSELLLELGRLDEAEQASKKVEDEMSRTILDARLAQARGDNQRALDLYGKISIQWPQNHAVRALAARAAYQLGDTERAKSDLLEATRQSSKETDAALWLAQIYFSEGNFRQAIAFAGRHLNERGALDPTAHLLTAESLAAMNQPEQGAKVLDELAGLRDGQFRNVAWAAKARLQARKDPAHALADLESNVAAAKVALAAPESQPLLDTLIDLQMRSGRGAEATRRVEGMLAEQPESAHLNALHGRLLLAAGRSDDAAAAFERALALAPNEGMALAGRALIAQAQGDVPKAIEEMKKAEAAAPDVADYAYMVARLTLDQGDRAAAREAFERVLRQHPDSAAAANDLAFLLAEDATDLGAAQRHAERAVRLQPSAETLDTLGFVKLKQGAAEEAVGMFERALARKPDYATARYHLALALIEKGEPVAAREALEQALEGSFPEQQEARKVLAKIDGGEARP
jgi:tetratricopeptide (TPR) repeat protein